MSSASFTTPSERSLHGTTIQEKAVFAFFRPVEPRETAQSDPFFSITIHVEGMDQAGIVYKVSRFLADNRINIVSLESTVKASPESGTALYVMDIQVQIPIGTAMEPIADGLARVADDLNVDISLSDQ